MKTITALCTMFAISVLNVSAAVNVQAAPTPPESPSELLEKGIYNQDTKGDIDSAIAIYQQVVAEASSNQSLAAQAQFRLGQCYLKKNQPTEATAAFQKLIHDFPSEKQLIAQARTYILSGLELQPIPWVDGERMQLNIALASGMDIGTGEYRADLVAPVNGRRVWRVGCRMMAGPQSVSSVDVDAESFRPLTSHWKHTLLGEVNATCKPDELEIQRVGKTQPDKIPLDGTVYDNEEAVHLMRRLPLQVGYKTTLAVLPTLGTANILSISLEVKGRETVQVPAGKFDCFIVHLGLVNQDFWFSADAYHYLVKFEAGPVTAQLTSIAQRKPGEVVKFHDDELGISFTAPADWVVWRARNGQPAKQELIRTLDPSADTDDGGMRLFDTDSLSETAQKSAGAWVEEEIAKNKNVKVRPDSWKNYTIDGRTGVACIAEYTESGKPRVQFLLRVLGAKESELFVITSAPEKFNALKAQFDTILTSYRTTGAGTNTPPLAATPGPNPKSAAEKSATSAAQAWLALIDDGNYAKSWQEASTFFQGAVTQKAWEDAMESVRKPLGKQVSRDVKTARSVTTLPGARDGQYVVMQFDASFTGKKSAIETVTFKLEKDGKWKATGYFIK